MTVKIEDVEKIYKSGRKELAITYLYELGYNYPEIVQFMEKWDLER